MSGEDPKSPAADTAEIDEGWGSDEPESALPIESAAPTRKAVEVPLARAVKPVTPPGEVRGKAAPKPLPPLPLPSTLGADGKLSDLDDDHIDFDDGSAIERDSLPTVQHPNPLMFDKVPESQRPKPPPLPKFRKS